MSKSVSGSVVPLLFAFCALVVGCGGSVPAASAPPSASPASPPPQSPGDAPQASPPGPAFAPAPSMSAGGAPPEETRGRARSEFDRARRDLEGARGDCSAACRALASMERAADTLCHLEEGDRPEDVRPVCDDAKDKLRAARERVRAACGACGSP